jgi:hypothetical protein
MQKVGSSKSKFGRLAFVEETYEVGTGKALRRKQIEFFT